MADFDLSLETLAALGEFVGGLAVILSLIYLARQVHQNTSSVRTENYARALERLAAIQSRLSSDATLAGVFARGGMDTSRLTEVERVQFTWAFYEIFGAFEFMFHQVESGALSQDVWGRWSATLAWWISLPGVRSWWEHKPAPFTSSFEALVNAYIANNPWDVDAARRWTRFLVGAAPISPLGDQQSRTPTAPIAPID